jgi:hypothetical protein
MPFPRAVAMKAAALIIAVTALPVQAHNGDFASAMGAITLLTLLVALLSIVAGITLPTYPKAVAAGAVVAVGWVVAGSFYFALDKGILLFAVGLGSVAVVIHTLRRLAVFFFRRPKGNDS